jgi:hypothetical protein
MAYMMTESYPDGRESIMVINANIIYNQNASDDNKLSRFGVYTTDYRRSWK